MLDRAAAGSHRLEDASAPHHRPTARTSTRLAGRVVAAFTAIRRHPGQRPCHEARAHETASVAVARGNEIGTEARTLPRGAPPRSRNKIARARRARRGSACVRTDWPAGVRWRLRREAARPLRDRRPRVARVDQRIRERPEPMAERSCLRRQPVRARDLFVLETPVLHGIRHELQAAGEPFVPVLDVSQRDGKPRPGVRVDRPLLELTSRTPRPTGGDGNVHAGRDVGIHDLDRRRCSVGSPRARDRIGRTSRAHSGPQSWSRPAAALVPSPL
jgi:hypothetical protein